MFRSLFLYYRRKKRVIDAVQSESNLNQIGSLRRKCRNDSNLQWTCWDMSSTRRTSPCFSWR